VQNVHKNDRYGSSRFPCCQGRWRSRSHDDINLQAQQLFGKLRKLIDAAVGGPEFNNYISAVDMSPFPQAIPEALDVGVERRACT
jgi:hypothetical protein